jgi:SAM-dependent methyltransferase
MPYSELTTADANPVKRFVQKRRLADAIEALRGLGADYRGSVLDYGGADGQLSRRIAARLLQSRVVCYEPAPYLAAEAQPVLADSPNAGLVTSLAEVEGQKFDFCFCLEVLEHLPESLVEETLTRIERLLVPGGRCVIGVPNEIFLPALIKGLFRMVRRPGQFDTRPANVFRAVIGRPPADRPLGEIAPGLPYHFFHMGFDYRRLRRALSERFLVERTYGSPVPWGPLGVNFEVYFVARKRSS